MEFKPFSKIPRLSRETVITEKIDGTNASVYIGEDGEFKTGSRTRWITPDNDNYGFSKWAHDHRDELVSGLGVGHHFGEWWGVAIQRGYGLSERRFSLFNVSEWGEFRPDCCHVVPVLHRCIFSSSEIENILFTLKESGSIAAPGFMKPEGVVIYHTASNHLYKKMLENDEQRKGE